MSEKLAKIAFLGIGSNLGNKKRNIELAKSKLEKNNITITKVSKIMKLYLGQIKKKPKFINIVLKIKTSLFSIRSYERVSFDIEK